LIDSELAAVEYGTYWPSSAGKFTTKSAGERTTNSAARFERWKQCQRFGASFRSTL